ncbi:MAG TPA: LamG domain-containing protein [Polyangiaceae bacterium]|nr:LamG domain-containing protein [Polyangiaceae bacterium]
MKSSLTALLVNVTAGCASIAGLDGYGDPAGGGQGGTGGVGGEVVSSAGGMMGTGGAGACAYVNAVEDSMPIAWWRLDEASGAALFNDHVNGRALENDGAMAGGSPIVCAEGAAADFAEGQAFLEFTGATALDFEGTASFSIEVWLVVSSNVFDSNGPALDVVRKLDDSLARGWLLRLDAGSVKWRRVAGMSMFDDLSRQISPEQNPLHLVATYDAEAQQMCAYGNGQPLGTCADAMQMLPSTSANLVVGASSGGALGEGLLDEVAIYDRALSAGEVEAHYDAGK